MAWLQQLPSGNFQISFGDRKCQRLSNIGNARQARSRTIRLEDTIGVVDNSIAEILAGVDVANFRLTEGKLAVAAMTVEYRFNKWGF